MTNETLLRDYSHQRYERTIRIDPGVPQWIERGPLSIAPEAAFNQAGAIHTIAIDPIDPNRIVVGSVNGGVWITANGRDAQPSWSTGTDHASSLSIASLAFDPLDGTRQTIWAGVGTYSSWDGGHGGGLVGLLRTIDGGGTWETFGGTALQGRQVRTVLPTGIVSAAQIILVGTDAGVFRSADGGATFVLLGQAEGMPAGSVDVADMQSDPKDPRSVLAACTGVGVFVTTDAGASWNSVLAAFPSNGLQKVNAASRIKLAIAGAAPGSWYVATFSGALDGLYRSTDAGGSWQTLAVPDPPLNVTYNMCAFGVDPANFGVVYAAGYQGVNDLQIGQLDNTGAMSWSACTGAGTADGSAHHGDSRCVVCDSDGSLLMGDDGGIYRLYDRTDASKRRWRGINGNLGITEVNSAAFDTLSNVAFSGHQDTGSAQQRGEGVAPWDAVAGGDGTAQDAANADPNTTLRFSCTGGNLMSLTRAGFDADGQLVEARRNVLLAAQGSDVAGSAMLPKRAYGGFLLNAVDPSRMILFGGALYEGVVGPDGSGDHGDHVQVVPLTADVRSINDNLNTAAYGGWLGGVANAGVLYVGFSVQEAVATGGERTFQRLFHRPGDGSAVVKLSFPEATVRGVAIDPNDWRVVYALGEASVYKSIDAGQNWSDISAGLGFAQTRTIAVVAGGGPGDAGAIVVGGSNGVAMSRVGGVRPWKRLGSNLPNVIVNDVRYYPARWRSRGPSGDVLVAGTIGRGCWIWPWNAWRLNASAVGGFQEHTWRGAWGSDGPMVVGDFNGDGSSDVMMWRDSTKTWTVNLSNGHGFKMHEWHGAWGSDGPIIVGDFNGDGRTDVMMWRDSTKTWTVNLSNGHGFEMHEWQGAWGSDGPIVVGDFNGDGRTDVMMWRDSTKTWTVNLSNGHGFEMQEWQGAWGSDGPIVVGDFNGDGLTDVMMWRDSTKSWTVNLSNGHGFEMQEWKGAWGSDGPIITGDFNGDGRTDVMMWRE